MSLSSIYRDTKSIGGFVGTSHALFVSFSTTVRTYQSRRALCSCRPTHAPLEAGGHLPLCTNCSSMSHEIWEPATNCSLSATSRFQCTCELGCQEHVRNGRVRGNRRLVFAGLGCVGEAVSLKRFSVIAFYLSAGK